MTFEEILPHLRAGKRIQRKGWDKRVFNPEGFPKRFQKVETYPFGDLRRMDILADDWQVYPEDANKGR